MPSSIFIPAESGFVALDAAPGNGSINSIAEHLGYHIDQYHYYFGDFDQEFPIQGVLMELFSRNIIAVITKDGVCRVDESDLNYFLRDLDSRYLYDSYRAEDSLTSGIENRSLPVEFLAGVLELEDAESDGVLYSDKLGLYLHFSSGYLVDFQAADGLNKPARHWKEVAPELFHSIESRARFYWGDNQPQVLHEINRQCAAISDVPGSANNEYLPLHTDRTGLPDFFMLMVSHYNQPVTLSEFLVANHGRYTLLPDRVRNNGLVYAVGKFAYEFAKDGSLKKHYPC